jgi:hypothetical protein
MTKLMHSLPWTLALTLAAQAGESEAIRIPETSCAQESCLDASASSEGESASLYPDSDAALYERIKKSLEM